MTRKDSVRAAAGTTKDSVRHAAEVVAPYAENARENAAHYAQQAGARLGPTASRAVCKARCSARDGYDQYVVPRIAQARKNMPDEWNRAADRALRSARQAADYAAPRIESAVNEARATAGPAREEAAARSTAALAALRGGVTAADIEKLARRKKCRARTGKAFKCLGLVGLVGAGAYAAWRWWDKQANPDWLVEPPPATEVSRTPADTDAMRSETGTSRNDADTGGTPPGN